MTSPKEGHLPPLHLQQHFNCQASNKTAIRLISSNHSFHCSIQNLKLINFVKSDIKMPDPAQINRSLSTIRTELEFLQASNVLSPPQFQSIMAQLPQNGAPSSYVDPRYNPNAQQQFNPSQISQEAQNPNNPAHPQNPKHHEWARNMVSKFGNAAMFGAGATFGGDLVNDVMRKF
ncbi:hypothetical protein B0J14DRAFT_609071 [Halenospora varia]|nr:hypothetical protein B0J14DRAFT_609071 [Halenospora varia]